MKKKNISDYIRNKIRMITLTIILAVFLSFGYVGFSQINSSSKHLCEMISIYSESISGPLGREALIGDTKSVDHILSVFKKKIQSQFSTVEFNFNRNSLKSNLTFKCQNHYFKSVFQIPIVFAGEIVGTLDGSADTFPFFSLIIVFLIMLFAILIIRLIIQRQLVNDLTKNLINPIQLLAKSTDAHKNQNQLYFLDEVESIRKDFHSLTLQVAETERNKTMVEIASQVSHDIRSPLSALSFLLTQINSIPEEKRILIRSAVNRISDIANSLLNHAKKQTNEESTHKLECTMLASLLDSIVSEKRISFRYRSNIQLEARLENSYGLFATVNPSELKRLLSNAINNSFESFETNHGLIEVILDSKEDHVTLIVKDNGKGIPPHVLSKLGEKGVTYGKEETKSGSGLGVYHAKQRIEAMGGTYEIQSTEGLGTSVIMKLKKQTPPDWFVQKIELKQDQYIIAIDDDNSILEIWKQRFSNFIQQKEITLITYSSGLSLKDWVKSHHEISLKAIYLIDYEFIGQKQTGLDFIEELNIGKQSILVSSHYEELAVKEKCSQLGAKLIPKGLASLIPIHRAQELKKIHGVLIDDDVDIIHLVWKLAATEKGKSILCFANEQDFMDKTKEVSLETPIYIDVHLGNKIKGQDVAARIHKLGFLNIYLSTGQDRDQIECPHFIINVVNKNFPL